MYVGIFLVSGGLVPFRNKGYFVELWMHVLPIMRIDVIHAMYCSYCNCMYCTW